MRKYLMLVQASADSEAGRMPTEAQMLEMGAFNQQLVDAGVMLDGGGLHPTSRSARVAYGGAGQSTVVKGPFGQLGELIAGYWIIQAGSLEEAIDWARRAPFQEGQVEIRPFFEAEDFGAEYTDEVRAQEDGLREQMAQK